MLRPLDVGVLLYLSVHPRESFAAMAEMLGISKSTAHGSVQRLVQSRLVSRVNDATALVALGPTVDFVRYGVPYAYAPRTVPRARGVMTGLGALPLSGYRLDLDPAPLVWPSTLGATMGVGVEPLIPAAPDLPNRDARLYELFALVDALRVGDAREREVAREEIARAFQRIPQ